MANEVSYNMSLALRNGTLIDIFPSGSQLLATQVTKTMIRNVETITSVGTAGVALTLGDVVSAGLALFQNLDSVNYVDVGIQEGGVFFPFVRLLPGQQSMAFLGMNAPYALANTSDVQLFYIIYSR